MTSLLLWLAFLVMGYFFLFVAGWAVYGMVRTLRAGQRSRKYLAEAPDPPLQVDHLPPVLQKLTMDTRLLRVSLELPVEKIRAYVSGEFETNNDDLEVFDNMLMNISRELGDWVLQIDRLGASDRRVLEDTGARASGVRAMLEREGWSLDRKNILRDGEPSMDRRLQTVIAELAKFEAALQVQQNPYR